MLVGSAVRRVAIIGGVRIPFARAHSVYAKASNEDMLTAVFRAAVARFKLNGLRLGDVAAGAVIKHTKDYNLTRECVLSSGLDPQTPGVDLQRACGTSLEAAILIGNKIALGQIECGLAGGTDSISDAPIVYPRSYQQLLLESYRGRGTSSRCCRRWSSHGPDCRWARVRSSWPSAGRSRARTRTSSPSTVTCTPQRPGAKASTMTWWSSSPA